MLFAYQPLHTAEAGDLNDEIINQFKIIRDQPNRLMDRLRSFLPGKDEYYRIRAWDRTEGGIGERSPLDRAARTIFLSISGYNGLYRVNAKGQNNVAYNHFRKWDPERLEEPIMRQSTWFSTHDITLISDGYEHIADDALQAKKADPGRKVFLYFDPPYDSDNQQGIVKYTSRPFRRDEQEKLRQTCDRLNDAGILFMLSNANTGFIREQYSAYHIVDLIAPRRIGNGTGGSAQAEEVVVCNYDPANAG